MMDDRAVPAFPEDLRELYTAATALSREPRLLDALAESRRELDLRRQATRNPHGFLEERGVKVPDGLAVFFGQRPRFEPRFQPGPDWEAFSVRMFDCRTYWIWIKDPDTGEYKPSEETICWGFEIVPHFLPGGPIA